MASIAAAIQAFIAPFSPLRQNWVQQEEEATLQPAMLTAAATAATVAVSAMATVETQLS